MLQKNTYQDIISLLGSPKEVENVCCIPDVYCFEGATSDVCRLLHNYEALWFVSPNYGLVAIFGRDNQISMLKIFDCNTAQYSSLEEVLNKLDLEWQEKIIFNMDLFR